jgi:hypothetical protein
MPALSTTTKHTRTCKDAHSTQLTQRSLTLPNSSASRARGMDIALSSEPANQLTRTIPSLVRVVLFSPPRLSSHKISLSPQLSRQSLHSTLLFISIPRSAFSCPYSPPVPRPQSADTEGLFTTPEWEPKPCSTPSRKLQIFDLLAPLLSLLPPLVVSCILSYAA